VQRACGNGATTVLLQGGHNPRIGLSDWLAYIRAIRESCPDIHIHPFSPAEYLFMAGREKPVAEILAAVYAEGIRTIPGGGAEILSETGASQNRAAQGRHRTVAVGVRDRSPHGIQDHGHDDVRPRGKR
jgi:2-iminoacetate synthase ThiH